MLTLSSDFGSPYPAAMKGVLCRRTDARLVDVAHDFPRQDVRTAAFWLREVLPYFPPAVHLVVIDPTVGTDRRAVAVRAGDHALIGPDNGVLRPVARELAAVAGESLGTDGGDVDGEGSDDADRPDPADADRPNSADGGTASDPAGIETFEVVGFDPESTTFHGRDVFAPAAGLVHEVGIGSFHADDCFRPIDDPVDLRFPEPSIADRGAEGEVLVVDGFGNVVTNVPGEVIVDCFDESISVNDRAIHVAATYAECDPGDPLVTVGSHGNVELAVREGRGDEAFGLGPGDAVELGWGDL